MSATTYTPTDQDRAYAEWEARMRADHTCEDKQKKGWCQCAFND